MATGYYLYFAYATKDDWDVLHLTEEPQFDGAMLMKYKGIDEFWVLTEPLPLGLAYYIWRQVAKVVAPEANPASRWATIKGRLGSLLPNQNHHSKLALASKQVNRLLAATGRKTMAPQSLELTPNELYRELLNQWPGDQTIPPVLQVLSGRILLPAEIDKVLAYHRLQLPVPAKYFWRWLVLQGKAQVFPGVGYQDNHILTCFRCGQTSGLKEVSCHNCGTGCYQCEECFNMGKSTYCGALYAFPAAATAPPRSVQVQLDWPLTPAQQTAAYQLTQFMQQDQTSEALVWAVCGAGKTEVCFEAMAQVLKRGGQVLFAIPRRDVVLELAPRLRKAFPDLTIATLYGGSEETFAPADITIATTHQTLRFFHKFDLVILDEVDAFPYRGSEMLQYAVGRAVKPQGKLIYLSATPDQQVLQHAKKGEITLIRIAARHHGHPLPEPQFGLDKGYSTQEPEKIITPELMQLLHQSVEGRGAQVFVFVPTISLVQRVGQLLAKECAKWWSPNHGDQQAQLQWVETSHAQDPDREDKRQRFAQGEFPIFVTTTIMERGITVPKADVLVLFAHHQVFDTGTLVQMAGRAGRSTQWPTGQVRFLANFATPAMKEALAQIRELNQYARQQGFLVEQA